MRETTCRPLAFCASVSPKRVSPRIAPLTSLSARSSALKSGEEIMGGNGMTSTSSRVFSTSNPPAPMLMGTTRRLRLVGMQLWPAAGGVVAEAMGAIENALLDAKAKRLGVPCYELLGG